MKNSTGADADKDRAKSDIGRIMTNGFLHRHILQEDALKIMNIGSQSHEHVIVDKADWENALKLLSAAMTQRDYLLLRGDGDLLHQDFSDAIKRCNLNVHR